MQDDRYKHLNIYGSPTLYTNNTLILGEKNVEGLILATGWHPETSEGNFYKDALKKWENKSGITWRTAMAYDTANVIIAGLKKVLKKTDTPSRVALQKEVTSPQFVINGATGKVKFFTECYQKDTDDPRKNELLSECAPGKRDGNTVFLMEIKESKEPRTGYEFGPILSKVKK